MRPRPMHGIFLCYQPLELHEQRNICQHQPRRSSSAQISAKDKFLKNTFYDKKYCNKNLRSIILLAIKLKSTVDSDHQICSTECSTLLTCACYYTMTTQNESENRCAVDFYTCSSTPLHIGFPILDGWLLRYRALKFCNYLVVNKLVTKLTGTLSMYLSYYKSY